MKMIKLNFRNKLFIIYALFIVIIITIVGNIYFYQSNQHLINREEQALLYNAQQVGIRFDDTIARMEHGIEFLLSDIKALDSIRMLASDQYGRNIPLEYRNEAVAEIRLTLHSYFLEKHFYRVVFFNQSGYVIANNNRDASIMDSSININDVTWLDQVTGYGGQSILIGLHDDIWGLRQNPSVFSLVKEIQGQNLGFVEVQYLASELDNIIVKPDDQTNVMLFTNDGKLLYAAEEYVNLEHYREIVLTAETTVSEYLNKQSGQKEMLALYRSDKTDTTLVAIENYKDIRSRQFLELIYMLFAWIIIAITSIVFVWIFAYKLTKPIKQVEDLIKQTELNNIGQKVSLDKSVATDEIISLYRSYRSLMNRLSDSIEKERQSSVLQMQAQFDTLQAQINPHFIYNILNVISQRGMMAEDETTCEICGSLADILRYSTNTKNKISSIEEELTYLDKYCFLLKTRFQHRFEYTGEISDSIKDFQIPKLTLQQLIENSITHGFSNSPEIMRVKLCCWTEKNTVYICMHDNGQGFNPETVEQLNLKFKQFKKQFNAGGHIPDLEIGGMGLVNTFARLYLLYKENLIFELSNDEGAKILIGIIMESE